LASLIEWCQECIKDSKEIIWLNCRVILTKQSYSSIKLKQFIIPIVLQFSQTKTIHHTNSLTAQSTCSIATDQFPFVKSFQMQKYEMFAWVLSSLSWKEYSTFIYRAHVHKCLVQPVVVSSIRPQFILLPTAPGITQALVTQVHPFYLVEQKFLP
jgi:hypothetical protein